MDRRLSQNGSSSGTDPGDQQHHGPDSNATAGPSDIAALLDTTATTPIGMTMATLAFAVSPLQTYLKVSSDGSRLVQTLCPVTVRASNKTIVALQLSLWFPLPNGMFPGDRRKEA